MKTEERRWADAGALRIRALPTLTLVAALGLGAACRKPAPPRRWEWQSGGLTEVLALARAQGTAVLVEVYAEWCPSCHQLERDVFDQNAGRIPTGCVAGLRVDFDSPEGQEIASTYRVINLPTSLVLNADGTELGRIEGYETVDGWIAALEDALLGKDDCAAVLARHASSPGDLELAAQAGAAMLARGDEEEGVQLLESVRAAEEAPRQAVLDATRTLGRWFFRVRRQYDRALSYFRDGVSRAGSGPEVWGFHYWTAMSLRALDRPDEAAALLDGLMAEHPGKAAPVALTADYLYMTGGDDPRALELARRAVELDPTDGANHYLVGVLAERTGDMAAALAAARRAVELEPGEAIYGHLHERLTRTAPAAPGG